MRYWTYVNTEILGPFEKEQLAELPGFTAASLICPETPAGAQTTDWKEASTYPEVAAALTTPATTPEKPRFPASESPLALTMRGSLIADEPVEPAPVPVPAPAPEPPASAAADPAPISTPDPVPAPAPAAPKRPAESPLALTMRGSLISDPAAAEPEAATPPAFSLTPITTLKPAAAEPPKEAPKPPDIPAGPGPDPRLEPLKQKVEQVGGALALIRNSQTQLLEELKHLEGAVAEIRTLLSSEPPKK